LKNYTSKEIKEFVSKPLFDEKIILNKDPNYPKISIITPSYNQESFLERTILSVLNQNYPNLEYIIIDGGSTDGSVEIIKKYEKYLTYWVSEKDRGQSHALNKGFRKVTGEIIGWINSDDIYIPGNLLKIGKIFKYDNNVDVVYGGLLVIDKNDNIIDMYWATKLIPKYMLIYGLDIHQQSLFWRKNMFKKVGYLDEKLYMVMDLDFIFRLSLEANLYRIKGYLGCLRRHGDTKTALEAFYKGKKENNIILERYLDKVSKINSFCRILVRIQRYIYLLKEAGPRYLIYKLNKRINKSLILF